MQRQGLAVPNQSFPVQGRTAFADADDDESRAGPDPSELLENPGPTSSTGRSIAWALGCAVLGAALAVAWRYADLQHLPSVLRLASAAQSDKSPAGSVEEQIGRLSQQVDALSKMTSDLAAAQQQITATVAALQAGQEDLAKRVAAAQSVARAWYSEPLMFGQRAVASSRSAPSVERPHPAKPATRKPEQPKESEHDSPGSLTSHGQ